MSVARTIIANNSQSEDSGTLPNDGSRSLPGESIKGNSSCNTATASFVADSDSCSNIHGGERVGGAVLVNDGNCNTTSSSESCNGKGSNPHSPKNVKNSAISPYLPDNQPHNIHFFSSNNMGSVSPNTCSYGASGSIGGSSSRINSVLMSSRRKFHSISQHIPLVGEKPKPPLGEAVRRALQALADAHNEMEEDRDPDPKEQIKEHKMAKKQKEKEMAAFNKKYCAVSGSARIKRVLNGGCESHSAADKVVGGVNPDVSRAGANYTYKNVSNAPYGTNDDIVAERENNVVGNNNTSPSPPVAIGRVSGNILFPNPEKQRKSSGGVRGFFCRLFCVDESETKESTRESQRAMAIADAAADVEDDDGNYIGDSDVVSLVPGGKVRVMAPSATATHVSMNAHKNTPYSSNSTNPIIVAKNALELEAEGGAVISSSSRGGSAATVVGASSTATTTPPRQQVGEDRTAKAIDNGVPYNDRGAYIPIIDYGGNDDINSSGETTRATTLNLNEILLRTTTTTS